ncbi:Pet127-domain-containing protein [Jackrogersella minutella]|nr:Pet127-domain-containing protein [Jackrogersella minutella]
MLQLSSRSAHRIGTSYVCASCFAASQSTRLLALRPTSLITHHGRPFSSTSYRATPTTEAPSVSSDGSDNVNITPPEVPQNKKAKSKNKPKGWKKAALQDSERQLQVLQGALQALKNVLAAQNISVDQIAKSNNIVDLTFQTNQTDKTGETDQEASDSKATDQVKTKAKSKSKKQAKPSSEPKSKKASSKKGKQKVKAKGEAPRPQKKKRKAGDNDLPSPIASSELASDEVLTGYQSIGEPFTGDFSPSQKTSQQEKEKGSKSSKKAALAIHTIHANELSTVPIAAHRPPVPSLSYGLERVLFNAGVYCLQDPRSRVYNFDPYLSEIMPIQEFDFNALKQYVTSSKDSNLIRIAKENNKRYTGSTSSMTSMLSHFHYLLSSWRQINSSMLSRTFEPDSVRFTSIMRGPAAVFLNWKDGTYAIDADKEFDTANILSMLGKSMEKLLTLTKEEYERYRHINSDQITEEERNAEEAFHYTGFGDFMMRSQLDAYDPRVPGSGMFDLKTRAVISIRMDAKGFHKGLGYEIRNRIGQWESFEREYYDMIRSAFLKYSLQVRMGRMDGIFVAFHNTQRIFGFQYIPLSEMDLALHGTSDTTLGNKEYHLSLALLNDILDRATKKYPEQSLRLHFETRTSVDAPFMYIFAKPVSQDDINEVQTANQASIAAFERSMLGIGKDEVEAESEVATENEVSVVEEDEPEESADIQEVSSLTAWKEVRQMVEDAMDDDEVGVGAVREAIEDALEQSGLLHVKSSSEARGYVDALLAAITDSMPPKPVESALDLSAEDGVASEEKDSSSAIQEEGEGELEPSSREQSASDNESAVDESQIPEMFPSAQDADNEPVEANVQVDESAVQSEPLANENEEPLVTSGSSEDQVERAEEHADGTVAEQGSATDVSVDAQPGESTAVVSEESATEDERAAEEENEEDEDDDETDDMDDELETGEPKKDINATSTMSPLKDLIVKMAQRIDDKAISNESGNSMDDLTKLKEFERILGEFISRSKDEQANLRTDNASQTPATEAEAETQDKAESTETPTEEVSEAKDSTEQSSSEATSTEPTSEEEPDPDLLGMVLTIKNKVDSTYVTRPENLRKNQTWTVEYNIEELNPKRAQNLYNQCKQRRRKTFEDTGDRETEWYKMFRGKLDEYTQAGRMFRAKELAKAKRKPVHIVGHPPREWKDVFSHLIGEDMKAKDELKGEEEPKEEPKEDADTI